MAEKILQLEGVNLVCSMPSPAPPNPDKCIICQKSDTKLDSLHGGDAGRKRVREAAELKDDIVHKRLNILGPNCAFKYHNTYACYKQYTDKRNLESFREKQSTDHELMNISESCDSDEKQETIHNPSTRSSNIPRPGPSSCIDPMYVDCTIYGSDRIRVKGKRCADYSLEY